MPREGANGSKEEEVTGRVLRINIIWMDREGSRMRALAGGTKKD